MRIALLGYGKMGKMIERIAIERGHEIVLIVDENNRAACTDEQLTSLLNLRCLLLPLKIINGVSITAFRWFPGQPVGWKDGMRWWLVAGNNKVDFSMPRISVSG